MKAHVYLLVLVIPWPSTVLGIYAPWYKSLRQQLGHGMSGLYYVTMASVGTCMTVSLPNMEMYTWHSAFIVGKIQSVLVQFYHYVIWNMSHASCHSNIV